MPTTYTDQFYQMDPANPPAAGTLLTPVTLNLVDQNNNGTISSGGFFNGDSLDGARVSAVYRGDTVTVDHNGSPLTITGTTFYLADGRRFFTPNDGTVLQADTFISSTYVTSSTFMPVGQLGPPCFTAGTLIAVPGGGVPVETLKAGDLVETMDRGPQPLRWIGTRKVAGTGRFAPVRIAAGTFGNHRALQVSPRHRMLVTGWMAELHFGQAEVLVAACHLTGMDGVSVRPVERVEYVHLLFDRHEIVFAEGAPSESFHPGSLALDEDREMRDEIAAIFPELADDAHRRTIPAARHAVTAREARLLVS